MSDMHVPAPAIAEVLNLLRATLSPEGNVRAAAERALTAAETRPGYLRALFAIVATPNEVHADLAQAASVYLKNLVRREWDSPSALHDEDKATVRDGLSEAIIHTHPLVRAQLAETLKRIISADFPANFPSLVPDILRNLSSSDVARVDGALVALRSLAKVYEFRGSGVNAKAPVIPLSDNTLSFLAQGARPEPGVTTAPERRALEQVVAATFPSLLRIFNALEDVIVRNDAQGRHDPKPHDMQRIICKIFWSCSQCALAPHLISDLEGVFSKWMQAFLIAVRRPVARFSQQLGAGSTQATVSMGGIPSQTNQKAQTLDEEELRKMPEWKVKQWIGHIAHRLFLRYSDPSRVDPSITRNVDSATLVRFAAHFRTTHAAPFTEAMLRLLSWDQKTISPRVANIAIIYLECAIAPAVSYRILKPELENLLTKVIFPYLCINDSDITLWTEDPVEYVRKSYDIVEDFYTPRAAASSLLFTMSKLRPSHVVLPFLNFLVRILDEYATCGADDPRRSKLARQKDGALLAIGTVRETLSADPTSHMQLEALLSRHVLPDFQSEFPFLRARACWLFGQLVSSNTLSLEATLPGLQGVRHCLVDKEFPVRVRAAVDIRHFLSCKPAAASIAPELGNLLTQLFTLLDDIDNTDIVATIDQVVVGFSSETAPFAVPLCKRLVVAFGRAASGVQDDEEAGFAAAQCVQALESIVTSVALSQVPNKIEVLADMEYTLTSIFDRMFDEDRMEFFEETLELLATFVYYSAEERGNHVRVQQESGQHPHLLVMGYVPEDHHRTQRLKGASGTGESSGDQGDGSTSLRSGTDRKGHPLDEITLSGVLAGEGVISPYLWSLYPAAIRAFHDWATDYSFHYMHPLDSYLSKGATAFAARSEGDSSYIQMLLGMVSRLWDESSLDDDDFAVQGTRVTALFLQHLRFVNFLDIDNDVAILTQLAVVRLRANSGSHRAVSALLRALAHLVYISPLVALTILDKALGCTAEIFRLWMSMVQQRMFDSKYDRKASAVALTSILASDWTALPPALHNAMPQVLVTIVNLLEELDAASKAWSKRYTCERHRKPGTVQVESLQASHNANGIRKDPPKACGFQMQASHDEDGDVDPSLAISSDEACQILMGSAESELKQLTANIYKSASTEEGEYERFEELPCGCKLVTNRKEILEEGENAMFCLLDEVDELLFFERVVRQLSPQASQSLVRALAEDDTRRIQGALHRAAESRRIPQQQEASVN